MGLVALAPRQLAVVAAALLVTLLFGEVIVRVLRRPWKLPTFATATGIASREPRELTEPVCSSTPRA